VVRGGIVSPGLNTSSMNRSTGSRSGRFRTEWLVLGAAVLAVGAVVVWALAREHANVAAEQGDRLRVQARVVNADLIRQIEGANKALEGIRNEIRQGDPYGQGGENGKLKLLDDAMPSVRALAVFDAAGTIVASSREDAIGKNFIERDYFQVPRRDFNPAMLYVSPPFKSAAGNMAVVLSRVLTDARGEFAGVVAATLDPDYFKVVLGSVNYAEDMRANLIHADGRMFITAPETPHLSEIDLAKPGTLFTRHKQGGQEITVFAGSVLGSADERMVILQTLRSPDIQMDKPLVVAVSRQLSAVFAPWRADAGSDSAIYFAIALGLATGLYFDQRRRTMLAVLKDRAAAERRHASDRVELALRGANLGLWDLDMAHNTFIADAREREMFGFSADEPLDQEDWRKLIHTEDWPMVASTFNAHLRGETDAQVCEHRMWNRDGRWVWVSARSTIVERDATGAPVRLVGTHQDITKRRQADAELARATELLRASEEQLREVTDNVPALIAHLDSAQDFRFANRAYGDYLGIDPASLIGRTPRQVFGDQVGDEIEDRLRRALSGERVTYERELATPTGPRQMAVTLLPRRNASGSVTGLFSLMHDITARHESERLRRRSEERLNLALEGSSLGLFDWDIVAGQVYHSAHAAAMRGEPAVEATAAPHEWQSFVHPDDLPTMLERMKHAIIDAAPTYDTEFRLKTVSGEWLWVRAHGRVVERDGHGRALRLVGTYADISARKRSEEGLRHLAEFDTLTDLPNRALFRDRLRQALARAAREKAMALMFLDIDHFKNVNDTLGHEAGDQLLKAFASRMRESVRDSDTVARLAGDEFTIILEGLERPGDASVVAEKLIERLREPLALSGNVYLVTASIGIALYVPGESNDAAILHRADLALYEAKRLGRNQFFCEAAGGIAAGNSSSASATT
jgi:diguanylate cyclase (GGDEF)-like protein/PAS domain S-box-containing protein